MLGAATSNLVEHDNFALLEYEERGEDKAALEQPLQQVRQSRNTQHSESGIDQDLKPNKFKRVALKT